ncbi:MAG: glycosyltransferase [Planctomycetia bacterium]|nr:glycosyltransferase [Planctomycetia bacterium]
MSPATASKAQASAGGAYPLHRPTICQVLHGLTVGGAEVLACQLARSLSERFHFVFACLDEVGSLGAELRQEGIRVECLQRRAGFDRACARRLAAWIRSTGAALVHAHQYTPFFYALASGIMRRRPPVLFTEHGRFFPDRPRWKRIVFNRMALRRRDRVVAVGEAVRQALIRNEGIPAGRVGVIYNGVDLQRIARQGTRGAEVRRELSLEPDELAILQVARLDGLKDHGTALRTMERVVRRCPRARLLLVGEGPERAGIEHEIRRRRLGSWVQLLGLRTDVPRLLAAADIFLLTSISEGIPVTLIEAMAARLPVVATSVGGVPEVVVRGQTGLLAPARDDAALADAVLRLARDPVERQRMGNEGHERATQLFSQEDMHAAYARLYEEMALARRG